MKDNLLVIIPAYNESKNIKATIQEIKDNINSCKILVIDDGSRDDSRQITLNMGCQVVSHPINLGAGAAIQTGLKYAVDKNYQLAVIIDGDGQHAPHEVKKMLDCMRETSADIVIGSRFLKKSSGYVHWTRRIGIIIFSHILFLLSGKKITDTTSGFRLFNYKAINYLANEIPLDFPDADMLLSLIFAGFKIVEVPVIIKERLAGRSMFSLLRCAYYPFKISISIIAVLIRKIFSWRKS